MGRKIKKKWGWYEVLAKGPGWKVKRLVLEPGKATSPHYHEYRNEQWTVATGRADVFLREGFESGHTYISSVDSPFSFPKQILSGQLHQLGNDTENVLEVIEVQTGVACEEGDKKRLRKKAVGAMPWK